MKKFFNWLFPPEEFTKGKFLDMLRMGCQVLFYGAVFWIIIEIVLHVL